MYSARKEEGIKGLENKRQNTEKAFLERDKKLASAFTFAGIIILLGALFFIFTLFSFELVGRGEGEEIKF